MKLTQGDPCPRCHRRLNLHGIILMCGYGHLFTKTARPIPRAS